jgi:hypothetical protein
VEESQLAKANLVHDLARLLVAPVDPFRPLILRQPVERAARKPRRNRHILVGNDQAVAPEEGDEPGDTGSRHPRCLRHIQVVDTQCPHIINGLPVHTLQIVIMAEQRGAVLPPL